MAGKVTGLGFTTLSVDDSAGAVKTIKNDITNAQWSTPQAMQDVTGIDKSAIERLGLLADLSLTLNGVMNVDVGQAHAVFKNVNTGVARTVTMVTNGITLAAEILFTDYAITRPQTGELTWSAPGVLANGTLPAYT